MSVDLKALADKTADALEAAMYSPTDEEPDVLEMELGVDEMTMHLEHGGHGYDVSLHLVDEDSGDHDEALAVELVVDDGLHSAYADIYNEHPALYDWSVDMFTEHMDG